MKHQATTGQYCIIQPISLCCLPWSAIGKCGAVGSVSLAFSGQGPAPDLTPYDCPLANIIIVGVYMLGEVYMKEH